MTHLDSSALATYNSLVDPNLKCFFSNERIQTHLRHVGLISRRGEIVSESEYRKRLVRREHRRHVRQMLAENIVHRAIDMERTRQAEIRRQLDLVAKVTLVNNTKETRRRHRAHSSIPVETTNEEIHPLSIPSSWSRSRSKSPTQRIQPLELLDEDHDEQQPRIPRVHSAFIQSKGKKPHSKISETNLRRSRTLNRPKSSNVNKTRSTKISADNFSSNPPCEITMIYYGPNMKIDYDQTLFEPVDEILVMQQHSGGENLVVYKGQLKAEETFTFVSSRRPNYPFGLTLYVKGLFDSRISTCCEYKHRHGVRLGGERGHFAILSVQGSKPCLKCRFDKHMKSKENEKDQTKSITIAIPPSDQHPIRSTPVKIPVRHSSLTTNSTENREEKENYSEDFDGDSKEKRSNEKRSSVDSTLPKSPTTTTEEKFLSERSSSNRRAKSPDETNSTSTIVSDDKSTLKTWQMTFHTTNTPMGSLQIPSKFFSKTFLRFSFLSENRRKQTEIYSIPFENSSQCFQSGRQDSFAAKLTNIGQPEEIQLILFVEQLDDDDENDRNGISKIKWHLDCIELIDPETQNHLKFPCQKWICPFEEHFLSLSSTFSRKTPSRSSLSSEDKGKLPSRTSSSTSKQKKDLGRSTHRISIYSSNETDGEFLPSSSTRFFLKINENQREILLFNQEENSSTDFSFRQGQMKTFDVNLPVEHVEKFRFGYLNSHITATRWKIEKIILSNKETNDELIFVPEEILIRNDLNFQAETNFHLQSDEDQRSTPKNVRMTSASLSSDNEVPIRSPTKDLRPKTRRGRDEVVRQDEKTLSNRNNDENVWRPSSSTDERTSNRTGKSNDEREFRNWYQNKKTNSNDDDDDDDEE